MNEKQKVRETNTQRIKKLEKEVEKLELIIKDMEYDIKMIYSDIRRMKK